MSLTADLHVHTHYSDDGEHSPAEILTAAASAGVDVLAFSDHDSVGAYNTTIDKMYSEVAIVPAVELSGALDEMEVTSSLTRSTRAANSCTACLPPSMNSGNNRPEHVFAIWSRRDSPFAPTGCPT